MPTGKQHSIFEGAPPPPNAERFDVLYQRGAVVIERIVSSGTQPPGQYCQPHDEWVLLLRGTATLQVGTESVSLKAGDYLTLSANLPHEVTRTSENALWLAVHIPPHERTTA
jgi:cupin 2 domain-containing protein